MPVLFKKITLQWLEEKQACNLEIVREYFKEQGAMEFDLTAENILKAHRAGILSSNWLARRVLTGAESAEYEREMKQAYAAFERRMAPFLARIILTAQQWPE